MRALRVSLLLFLLVSVNSYLYDYSHEYFDRTISFVGDHNYPPYEFTDNDGQPVGFNIDILRAIAEETGLDIKIELMTWSKAIDMVDKREADALTGMMYSIERAETFHFSRPHSFVDMAIILSDHSPTVSSEADLFGKSIVVQQNDIMHEFTLRKGYTDQLIAVPNISEGLLLLSTGVVDVGLFTELPAKYTAEELDLSNIRFVNGFMLRNEYCFATLHENSFLNSILNEGLLEIKESGLYWDIHEQWLGKYDQVGITYDTVLKYIVISLILLGLLALVILIWTISIKSSLKKRTMHLDQELQAHKKTSIELQKSTDRFKYIFENVPEFIFETDISGKILFANKNIKKILGYNQREAIGSLKLSDLIHPNDIDKLKHFYSELQEKGNSVVQLSGLTKNRLEIQLILYSTLKTFSDKESRILGIGVDFTYQWKQEILKKTIYEISDLTHESKNLPHLFKKIHQAVEKLMPAKNFYIALYNEKSNTLSFPYFVDEVSGRPNPKRQGKGMTEYVMNLKQAILVTKQEMLQLYEQGKINSIDNISEVWLGVPLIINQMVIGVVAVQDFNNMETYGETEKQLLNYVSEQIAFAISRKRAEEQIQQKTILFEELFCNAPTGIVLVDREDRVLNANQAFLSMFAYKHHEIVKRAINDLIVPPDHQEEAMSLSRSTQNMETASVETIRQDKYGKLLNVIAYGVPVLIDGELEAIYGIYVDITELHKAKTNLSEERDRLQVMLGSIGDGVIATDDEGKIVLMNKIASDLTGFSMEEALNLPIEQVFSIFNEITGEDIDSIVRRVIETREISHLSNHTVLRSRNGENYIIEDSAAPIIDESERLIGIILVFRDSTEKKRLEVELQRNAKLESIGILAGGIAHDFNNILTSIIGNLTLARKACNKKKIFDIDLKLIEAEKASLRARKLTQQLLTYSKGGEPVKSTASVKEILEETVDFATLGSNITTELKIDDNIWNIEVDAGQIGQVINNLTINGVQAMPEGGILTITAFNCDLMCEKYKSLQPGKYVLINIIDTGKGIDRETLKKIFDPFFTTKTKGTGLGLTTSIGIIKNHNGYMTVDSELGKGSTFSIYLPATDKKPKNTITSPIKENGNGHVLLMDDDQSLAGVVTEMLETLGYTVTVANNGEEAISIYKTMLHKKNRPDVVVLDLTIPGGMGGKDVVKELLKIDPEANCIVSSGYSSDPIMARYKEYGFRGVLAKPYSFKELANTLAKFTKDSPLSDNNAD